METKELKHFDGYFIRCQLEDGTFEILKGEKVLPQYIHSTGYKAVSINGKARMVHQLIAKQFLPNDNNGKIIKHIDGDKLNNKLDNLQWIKTPRKYKYEYFELPEDVVPYEKEGCEFDKYWITKDNKIIVKVAGNKYRYLVDRNGRYNLVDTNGKTHNVKKI